MEELLWPVVLVQSRGDGTEGTSEPVGAWLAGCVTPLSRPRHRRMTKRMPAETGVTRFGEERPELTKRTIDALAATGKDAVFWDRDLAGFGVSVYVTGRKVFVVQTRGPRGPKRITLGRYGQLLADDARKQAAYDRLSEVRPRFLGRRLVGTYGFQSELVGQSREARHSNRSSRRRG